MEISWAESIGFTVGLFLGIGIGVVVRGMKFGANGLGRAVIVHTLSLGITGFPSTKRRITTWGNLV